MPLQREHLQLGALLLCVPLQLLLTDFMGSNEGTRTYAISKLVNQFSEIRDSWLRVEPWKLWCNKILRMNFLDLVSWRRVGNRKMIVNFLGHLRNG